MTTSTSDHDDPPTDEGRDRRATTARRDPGATLGGRAQAARPLGLPGGAGRAGGGPRRASYFVRAPRASTRSRTSSRRPRTTRAPAAARCRSRSRAATRPPRSAATLKAKGVVASVQAFIDAANGEPDASGIQVGYYQLKKQMAAADASRSWSTPPT